MPGSLLIVDDHADFRRMARSLLTAEGWEVVGEAPDGESALVLAADLRPDVVLLDIQLPGLDGIEVARRLADGPSPPVIVLISSRSRHDFGPRLRGAPALGFLSKDELTGAALAALVGPS